MDRKGVLESRTLPDPEFEKLWDRIFLPDETKTRIVSQILLEFTMRGKLDRGAVPLHGVILLTGPPGTGKTSFAKAAASKAAHILRRTIRYLAAEPHGLTSSSLGKTQRAVRDFLHSTVAETASNGPLIILLDEVETLAASRARMSFDANPIDVHRATDALLAGLDVLAEEYPHLLFIATTNFEGAIDEAFLSRADLVEYIGKPDRKACREILVDTLSVMAEQWPEIQEIPKTPGFEAVVDLAVGLDGRQIRKIVLQACTLEKELAINPGLLKLEHLERVLAKAKKLRSVREVAA